MNKLVILSLILMTTYSYAQNGKCDVPLKPIYVEGDGGAIGKDESSALMTAVLRAGVNAGILYTQNLQGQLVGKRCPKHCELPRIVNGKKTIKTILTITGEYQDDQIEWLKSCMASYSADECLQFLKDATNMYWAGARVSISANPYIKCNPAAVLTE